MDVVAQLLQGRLLSYDDIQSLVNQKSPSNPYREMYCKPIPGRQSQYLASCLPLAGYHVAAVVGKLQLEHRLPLCGRQNLLCPSCRSLGKKQLPGAISRVARWWLTEPEPY